MRESRHMDKSFFMVVGAGLGQIPAIKSAKSLGYKVIAVDKNPSAPGMDLADIPVEVDILDIEQVVEVARKYSVKGVLTMQSDIGVPTVGAVVDALCLVGNGKEVADRCSNKILTREALSYSSVLQPNYAVVGSIYEAEIEARKIGFPCIIKSPDSSGSRGVIRVNTDSEIKSAFCEAMRHTRGNSLLVEEFIEGVEVGAQAFSVHGRCRMVLVHDDELSNRPYMIPIAHAFPSTLEPLVLRKVEETVANCVNALKINNGPSNIDLIIDMKGRPRIIEVGARIGATCLPELIQYHTGIDWTKSAVEVSCGILPDIKKKYTQPCAAFILESKVDGVMIDYSLPKQWAEHPNVLEWEVNVKPGDVVTKLKTGTDRVGKVLTKASTVEEAINIGRGFREAFAIIVE